MHILVFGDSIAYGAWDLEGGWIQRLRKFFDERQLKDFYNPNIYCLVYNLGISGDTTKEVLERFDFEAKMHLEDEKEIIIIFSIGSNDSEIILKTGKTRLTESEFKKNLDALIKKARKFSSKIIFTGLLPVDESRVDPIPWAPDTAYRNEAIKKFDSIIKSVCRNSGIHFIPLEKFWKINYKKLLTDGCHPNSNGHEIIFNIVSDYLAKKKIIYSM